MSYDTLFSPITLGDHDLRNRIAHVATVSGFGRDRKVTDDLIAYHRARAEGGAAMIVTELLNVHPTSTGSSILISAHDEANFDGFKRWAEAVEGAGCRLVGQLGHIGRQQLWGLDSVPVSSSSLPESLYWNSGRPLAEDEIPGIVAGYADTAERLQRAGFSGVELHGAHGYLIAQFLSPSSNDRTDRYGGSLENRTRFMREAIAAVRAACGEGFIVGIKLPADERIAGGIDPDEAERIAAIAAATGQLDYLAFSQGAFGLNFDAHLPDMHYPPRPFLPLHARLRKAADGLPVMGLGRIESPEAAEQALANGMCDLVGFSRMLISDPAWPEKMRTGRPQDARVCIYCNYCWGEIARARPLRCYQNPMLATAGEADWKPSPAESGKRVTVVGAGFAGLEAAWIAGARGHTVTLFGASGEPGGWALLESRLPGRTEVAHTIDYQYAKAQEFGVTFRFGAYATADDVLATKPDVIVLATGSTMRPPPSLDPAADAIPLRDLKQEFSSRPAPPEGATAALLDMEQTGRVYAGVEQLAQYFDNVLLLTPAPEIARPMDLMSQLGVHRRLAHLGVKVERLSEPLSLVDGVLTVRHVITGETSRVEKVTCVVYATPRIARDDLARDLAGSDVPVHLIGDCRLPRDHASAIHEGHRLALSL